MSEPLTLEQARAISPALLNQLTPLPEVTELDPDDGWTQWDLAVRLHDSSTQERPPL